MNKMEKEKQKRRNARDLEFLKAVKKGDFQAVRRSLDSGAKIESFTPQNGKTALLEACSRGYEEIIKLLIERGADLRAIDFKDQSALRLAANERIRDLVRKHMGSDYSFSDFRSRY